MDTKSKTHNSKSICIFQWVFVLLMGLLGAICGAAGLFSPTGQPGGYREIGAGLMIALTVSGVGVSLYMRWKNARRA